MLLQAAAILVALLTIPAPSLNECVGRNGEAVLSDKSLDLVFSGRVAEVTRISDFGYRVVIDVERVWKGAVSPRFVVYGLETDVESPRFRANEHRVVLARTITDARRRQALEIPESDVIFGPAPCSGPLELSKNIEQELGPSHAPTTEK
jgi:hypothetical protein